MKKKLLIAIIAICSAFICAFGFVACTDNGGNENEVPNSGNENEISDGGNKNEEDNGSGSGEGGNEEEKHEQVTAEEWQAAVLATAAALNCTVEMTDYELYVTPDGEEIRAYSETAKFDMANNLVYWDKCWDRDATKNTYAYYDIVCYNLYDGDKRIEYSNTDEEGWIISERTGYSDEELVYKKFGVNHGYDIIETLKYLFRDDFFNDWTKHFKDMYADFSYNEEDGTYTYYDASTEYNYTVAFGNGFITNINIKAEMQNGDMNAQAEMNFDFIAYGTTELSIPQNVIDNAVPFIPENPDKE